MLPSASVRCQTSLPLTWVNASTAHCSRTTQSASEAGSAYSVASLSGRLSSSATAQQGQVTVVDVVER